MDVHEQWTTPAFDLEPVAADTGPFVRRDLLEAWWKHRGGEAGEIQLVEGRAGLIPLFISEGEVRFLGEPDLTDYHSPLGEGTEALVAEYVSSVEGGIAIIFDSLPAEAAAVVAAGLARAGLPTEPIRHEIAAVLRLPETYEEWLTALDRKQRHEVRRKERRYVTEAGRVMLLRESGSDPVASFAALHRRTGGSKGEFMTDEMEAFFLSLRDDCGGVVDVLLGPRDVVVAAAFGFEDDEAYYLYNSAYDPAAGELSAGSILVTGLIRRAINSGKRTFDFLKGDEPYKFRHGAVPRPLYELRARTGTVG